MTIVLTTDHKIAPGQSMFGPVMSRLWLRNIKNILQGWNITIPPGNCWSSGCETSDLAVPCSAVGLDVVLDIVDLYCAIWAASASGPVCICGTAAGRTTTLARAGAAKTEKHTDILVLTILKPTGSVLNHSS